MFFDIGWGNLLVLAVVGFFIFGPERLPKLAAEAARMVRQLRAMANDATRDLRDELDPGLREDLSHLADLHPRRFVRSLLDEPGPEALPAPRPAPAQAADPDARLAAPPFDSDAT